MDRTNLWKKQESAVFMHMQDAIVAHSSIGIQSLFVGWLQLILFLHSAYTVEMQVGKDADENSSLVEECYLSEINTNCAVDLSCSTSDLI